jgi:hypothetical protein
MRFAAQIAFFTAAGAFRGAVAVRPLREIFARLVELVGRALLPLALDGAVPPVLALVAASAEAGIASASSAVANTPRRSPCRAMNWSSLPSRFRS